MGPTFGAMATRERPQLREESVESLLKQAGRICLVCWVPLLILSLVSTLYGTVIDSYTLIPGLGFPSSQTNASLHHTLNPELSKNISAREIRVSRGGFYDGLYEGPQDKGLLAQYIASFFISLDEAVMQSLVESKNKMAMYKSVGVESSSVGSLASQNSEVSSHLLNPESNSAHLWC